jgi:hypothetical protein
MLGSFKRPTLFPIKGLTVLVGMGKPMDLCVCVSEERGNVGKGRVRSRKR